MVALSTSLFPVICAFGQVHHHCVSGIFESQISYSSKNTGAGKGMPRWSQQGPNIAAPTDFWSGPPMVLGLGVGLGLGWGLGLLLGLRESNIGLAQASLPRFDSRQPHGNWNMYDLHKEAMQQNGNISVSGAEDMTPSPLAFQGIFVWLARLVLWT